jgi:hypothetical protein
LRVRIAILLLVALTLSCRNPELPVNTVLWRLDTPWATSPESPGARVAKATLISFRSGDEFIEHHCEVIERGGDAVYIVSRGPRLVSVGTWTKKRARVTAIRRNVHRKPPLGGAVDPACANPELVFRIEGQTLIGETGDMSGVWSPLTRLVSPDYESYINLARNSPVKCPVSEE